MPEKFDELGELTAEINLALQKTDVAKVCAAIGSAIKLHNASDIARKAGIERPSICRAFGSAGSPNFSTVLKVLGAMGLQLKVAKGRKRSVKRNGRRPARRVASQVLQACGE